MKIIDYDESLDKRMVTDSAYRVCERVEFPVTYPDVYDHLFGSEENILKLLIDEKNRIAGFGVFENYQLYLNDAIVTMVYLSGMVIDKKYQGKNISQEIIRSAYMRVKSDLIALRTQNIAMAKSLLSLYPDILFKIPGDTSKDVLECLKQVKPFERINSHGVIENCYPNQLYPNLGAIRDFFGVQLSSNDSLAVVIEPSKGRSKTLSIFRDIK